ncbi:hypothetical protein [Wolbachia endosymbiont of Folsomia candida]|uniref:hypothetical protein n=1 Tax=Wolbachia endosymbiont of Folsomia candida TaxID=169402 RepID=UPI001300B4E7|nr:hypothetical protein [Wolbachia endosymbiont of Folsomia candida]
MMKSLSKETGFQCHSTGMTKTYSIFERCNKVLSSQCVTLGSSCKIFANHAMYNRF